MPKVTTTHHHPSLWHAGDQPRLETDWGLHQVLLFYSVVIFLITSWTLSQIFFKLNSPISAGHSEGLGQAEPGARPDHLWPPPTPPPLPLP